jgi:cytoskeletal protein RodZ
VVAIGAGLREAREQQGLSVEQAAATTRIAARHLRALEEERFERLPEPVYVRGFLREYALFLGLRPQPFLDEYAASLGEPEPPPPLPRARRKPVPVFRPRRSGAAVALALTVVLVALLAWRYGGTGGQQPNTSPSLNKPPTPRTHPPHAAALARQRPLARTTAPRPRKAKPALARVVLTASNGRCWLEAHLDSAAGKQLYSGVLEQGQTTRLQGRRLWMRLGAPSALTATLNGRGVTLPSATGNIIVTPGGISTG